MFEQNKYTDWYWELVNKARLANRKKLHGLYYENHHIIPRSLGGSDDAENLVLLTPREHFVCHLLLVKMVNSPNARSKMACAFNRFKAVNPNSKTYDRFKQKYGELCRGENNPSYGKIWCHTISSQEILYLKPSDFDPGIHVKGLPEQRGGHFDTKWINDGYTERMIPKEECIPVDWVEGRLTIPPHFHMISMAIKRHTFEKDKDHSEKLKGRIRVIKPSTGETKSIAPHDLIKHPDFEPHTEVVTSLSKTCIIDGVTYPSLAAAGRKYNVSTGVVAYRIRSTHTRWSTWVYGLTKED